MVFFPHWYQAGIKQISDLFYSCEGHFLPFNSFGNKFNVKCYFLQYYSILSSIPQTGRDYCKKVPKTQLRLPPQSVHWHARQYTLRCLTLKIYLHQLLRKKLLASGVEKSELTKIYLLPFKATREIKLTMFQYKIIHRILPTNSLLHKNEKSCLALLSLLSFWVSDPVAFVYKLHARKFFLE